VGPQGPARFLTSLGPAIQNEDAGRSTVAPHGEVGRVRDARSVGELTLTLAAAQRYEPPPLPGPSASWDGRHLAGTSGQRRAAR
jgi:hypothetical protein